MNSLIKKIKNLFTSQSEDMRARLANEYISGEGIEIGALHAPLPVPEEASVKYVDRMSVIELLQQYPEMKDANLLEPDIIDDGETLAKIKDNSQDFVIANHFLEHCEDPIKAILNMLRVLKKEGFLFLTVPDMHYTFDKVRTPTSFEHVLKDHQSGPENSRRKHYEDWVRLINQIDNESEIQKQVAGYMEMKYSIHFHAWTKKELQELIDELKKMANYSIEEFITNNDEIIIILKKR